MAPLGAGLFPALGLTDGGCSAGMCEQCDLAVGAEPRFIPAPLGAGLFPALVLRDAGCWGGMCDLAVGAELPCT